ncbi:MAG: BglII/BstYI family type II restriction endonuclease [Actinomycetota bacterium]
MAAHALLGLRGYKVAHQRHASAILTTDYVDVCDDLVAVLRPLKVKRDYVIAGGGGKSLITQGMERSLRAREWDKKVFRMSQTIDEAVIESNTHEIDHFKGFDDGRPGIALEIEWNNKDPFYDRDLETFARLHRLGVISAGVIITRGPSLQNALKGVLVDHYKTLSPTELRSVVKGMRPEHRERVQKAKTSEEKARIVGEIKFSSKYGTATTHWNKLMERTSRGLGNPCPLLLIGIEASRLVP